MNFFNRKVRHSEITSHESEISPNEEILYVAKAKYNRHENAAKNALFIRLRNISEITKIRFKKIKMRTRIEEYDEASFALLTGFLHMLNKALKGNPIVVGELSLKINQKDIEIHLSYLQGKEIKKLINKSYRTDFGTWKIYEANGICLSAFFNKETFNKKRDISSKERESHV